MLVHADPSADSISLLSFPRDMQVEIHCPGRTPFFDRINHAYATCGPQGGATTVKALTGLQVNYLITVKLHSFPESSTASTARGSTSTGATSTIEEARRATPRSTCSRGMGRDRDRTAGAQLRALPPHGFRPVPRRASAAVRQVVQGAGAGGLRRDCAAQGRQHDHEERRGRAGGRQRRRRPHRALVRAVRVRASAWTHLPVADRGILGLR